MAKARRFKLNQDTGITIKTQNNEYRVDPGQHYTTDDPREIDAYANSPFMSEVKIPDGKGKD